MAQSSFGGFTQPRNNSVAPTVLVSTREKVTISSMPASGTINFDVSTQSILYYTQDATGNFVINIRGDANNSLNSVLFVGNSISVVFMVTNGATAFYPTSYQIDGVNITPRWLGGTAPTSGNASGIDAYTLTLIKISSANYQLLASRTQYK